MNLTKWSAVVLLFSILGNGVALWRCSQADEQLNRVFMEMQHTTQHLRLSQEALQKTQQRVQVQEQYLDGLSQKTYGYLQPLCPDGTVATYHPPKDSI